MTAAGANQETDTVVKAPRWGLDGWTLTLAGDGDGVGRSATVGLTLAGNLSAAVWVHAVDQAVWKSRRDGADRERGRADMDIVKEKHGHLHFCAELMTPSVIRVH